MEKLIKEKILYILVVIVVIIGGLYGCWYFATLAIYTHNQVEQKKDKLETKQDKLAQIRKQKAASKVEKKKESESGKVIYEVLGQQFSPEASFGIMFENVLSNMTNSGVRIRSIDYNYQPTDDKILFANVPGYNACELSFTAIGNYSQFQRFFKNIAKENYLSNIYEVYIEPYDKDKTILIVKFKIRLYTKTV